MINEESIDFNINVIIFNNINNKSQTYFIFEIFIVKFYY